VKAWKITVTLAAALLIALAVRLPIATTPGFFHWRERKLSTGFVAGHLVNT
jgi:hypothetical protein